MIGQLVVEVYIDIRPLQLHTERIGIVECQFGVQQGFIHAEFFKSQIPETQVFRRYRFGAGINAGDAGKYQKKTNDTLHRIAI